MPRWLLLPMLGLLALLPPAMAGDRDRCRQDGAYVAGLEREVAALRRENEGLRARLTAVGNALGDRGMSPH